MWCDLGKLLNLLDPWCLHWKTGIIILITVVGVKEAQGVMCSAQRLALSKGSISGRNDGDDDDYDCVEGLRERA